jgi:hypothetical protein
MRIFKKIYTSIKNYFIIRKIKKIIKKKKFIY